MFLMPFEVVLSLTFLLLLTLMELFYLLFLLLHKILFFSTNVAKQALDFPLLDTMVSNSQCLKIFLPFPLCYKFLSEIAAITVKFKFFTISIICN